MRLRIICSESAPLAAAAPASKTRGADRPLAATRKTPVSEAASERETPPQSLTSISDIDVEAEPLLAAAIRELGARIVKIEDA